VKLSVAVGSLVLACGLILAAFISRSGTTASAAAAPEAVTAVRRSAFPAPPRGAVVFSRQLGGKALALGVFPKGGHVLLQGSVLGSQVVGVSGLDVLLNGRRANACGPGCYRAAAARDLKGRRGSRGHDGLASLASCGLAAT
jgi:hypothetical protein